MSEPAIPFGYKRVTGQSQKGDGIWNGTRFERVKKAYPDIKIDDVVIRKCAAVQTEIAATVDTTDMEVWDE